ncbi:MAG TPA: ATPase, T2SS/T4P/T4SS family [Phycisphaerae bacterium]|nr:ATPase, T2SS/T4P/T4SS family [Phycisphaerae bacterium]HRY70959.1 ATPase, T2SS/T4P/T4SS family [Phycisphaerae bacterium]HSA29180.1 ATPase, T2SS/T4P/T4SS family [Phycisphaerae bacterium]
MAQSLRNLDSHDLTNPDIPLPPEPLARILREAVDQGATDIHVDTWGNHAVARYRIDGVARELDPLDLDQARRLINQVKVSAKLNIEATLQPLEGQFRWQQGEQVRDIRVTIIPEAPRNEAAHLRLLTRPEDWRHMEQLGMRPEQLATVRGVMQRPHGLVLVAGPTGSGKTTTLYALTELEDLRHLIAASIEDPIEFDLPYVRQLEVDKRHGITMREGLRTLLRMDADLLMVGEIRDGESAIVAAQAALAGRLVLATIHARDAASVISTMRHLGVPPYVLASSLRMVIAQTLVRKLCGECTAAYSTRNAERKLFEQARLPVPDTVRVAKGCSPCGQTGFKGRTGVFQVAVFDESHGAWLADGPPEHEVRERLVQEGTQSLNSEVLQRAADGTISLSEAARVVGAAGNGPGTAIEQKV